jgi:hypothetical protein
VLRVIPIGEFFFNEQKGFCIKIAKAMTHLFILKKRLKKQIDEITHCYSNPFNMKQAACHPVWELFFIEQKDFVRRLQKQWHTILC